MSGGTPVAGVTLISVMLLVAVAGLLQGRAAETWDSQVRHEQEEDLIFFGEQYKWGLEQYWAMNGRPPSKLEDLCPKDSRANRRFLRQCYLDPITGKDFRLIPVGGCGKKKLEKDKKKKDEDDDKHRDDLDEADGPRRSSVELHEGPGQESHVAVSGDVAFIGVASTSEVPSFRIRDDAESYDEWEFCATPKQSPTVRPGQGIPGRPGIPGQGGGVGGGKPPPPGGPGGPGRPGGGPGSPQPGRR